MNGFEWRISRRVNGRTVTEGVRKMLEETIDHCLSLSYNLSGKGKQVKGASRNFSCTNKYLVKDIRVLGGT